MPEPKLDQLEVRATALGYATQLLGRTNINSGGTTPESVTASVLVISKKLETYIWGRFAPNENPPTPLSTIGEAADRTRAILLELAENSADVALKAKVEEALGTWERFKAEIVATLGPLYK